MENAVQVDAKNGPPGTRCNCEDRSFTKKFNYPILGDVRCDGCGQANMDYYWVCQKSCGHKFCNECMDQLGYPKPE